MAGMKVVATGILLALTACNDNTANQTAAATLAANTTAVPLEDEAANASDNAGDATTNVIRRP